jgi:hypothetical protein
MDIWGPKLIWCGIKCNIIIWLFFSFFLFGFFLFRIIKSWIVFFSQKHFNYIFFLGFVKISFDVISHDVHIRILHLYKIHSWTHSLKFELKISWKHTKVWNTKPLQNFINNVKITLLSLTWNFLKNSKFNILFFSKFFIQMLQMKTWS